jgi:hypothetical protein
MLGRAIDAALMRSMMPKIPFSIWMLIAVMIGILIRLALIIPSGWRMDYDEAMVGLLGLRVLRGEFMTFIPAQATLGAIEPYLLAPLFGLLGATPLAVRILSLLLSAAYIVTVGLLARTAFDEQVGIIAAVLAAIAPPYMLVTGMKIWGSTIETLVLGNVLLLVTYTALNAQANPNRAYRIPLQMGLIGGVMFWIAWLGFYYFVPVGVMLLWRGREAIRRGWWAGLIGCAIGSAPFWVFNLTQDWATFATITGRPENTVINYDLIVQDMFTNLYQRMVTGDSYWGLTTSRWLIVPPVIYGVGLIALMASVRLWHGESGKNLRWMLAIFVIAVPVLYVLSGYGQGALNEWGLDATGRYVLMLHSVLPIGVAALIVHLWRAGFAGFRLAGAVLLVGTIGVNLLGVWRTDPVKAFDSPYYDRLPISLDALVDYLDEQQIRHVWVDNGIGHVLMFQTQERILAADYYDTYLTYGFLRFPDVLAEVEAAERTAFVVPVYVGQIEPPIERALNDARIVYESADVLPTLRVYVPEERVDPAVIAAGLGYQY